MSHQIKQVAGRLGSPGIASPYVVLPTVEAKRREVAVAGDAIGVQVASRRDLIRIPVGHVVYAQRGAEAALAPTRTGCGHVAYTVALGAAWRTRS